MSKNRYIRLENRGLLQVSGEDAQHFLQGIITNDINNVTPEATIYACLLTPQGKFLFDFFIFEMHGDLVLDCAGERLAELEKRLRMYTLRSKVDIYNISEKHHIFALFGESSLKKAGFDNKEGKSMEFCGGYAFIDPRSSDLGARCIVDFHISGKIFESFGFFEGSFMDYEAERFRLGIPDGFSDLIPEKSFPLQYKMEEMHAIDYKKGCYVGQEVTARTHYQGTIRRSLFPIKGEGDLPPPGTDILLGEKRIGEVRSSCGSAGLGLIEIEALPQITSGNIPEAEGIKLSVTE